MAEEFTLLQAVAGIGSAALGAGATVGAAAIGADAAKYQIRQQSKTSLLQTLAEERVALGTERFKTERERIKAQTTTSGVSTGAIALVILALLWSYKR